MTKARCERRAPSLHHIGRFLVDVGELLLEDDSDLGMEAVAGVGETLGSVQLGVVLSSLWATLVAGKGAWDKYGLALQVGTCRDAGPGAPGYSTPRDKSGIEPSCRVLSP